MSKDMLTLFAAIYWIACVGEQGEQIFAAKSHGRARVVKCRALPGPPRAAEPGYGLGSKPGKTRPEPESGSAPGQIHGLAHMFSLAVPNAAMICVVRLIGLGRSVCRGRGRCCSDRTQISFQVMLETRKHAISR